MTHLAAHPAPVVRTLLDGAIDYAGLFPPAALDLRGAVSAYLEYRESADAWALGRFVVPVSQLTELGTLLRETPDLHEAALPLSALIGPGTADDADAVDRFNRDAPTPGTRIASLEVKAGSEGAVRAVLAGLPRRSVRYVEVTLGANLVAALDAVAAGGACAKVRTGGTTPDAIPGPDALLDFLIGAARRNLAFKATAGLHHALRGVYPLTYAADAPSGMMYGFLNLMLASAVLWSGGERERAREALLEHDPLQLRLNGDAIMWRDHRFDGHALGRMRAGFFHGFGSCSFTEPMDELPSWSRK